MKAVIAMPPASVLLREVLKNAGAPIDDQLREPAFSTYVVRLKK